MDFYDLDYIVSHQSSDSALRVAAILVLLVTGMVFGVLYLRDRIRTRWRDVGVGALVLSLILIGVQAEQYLQVSNRISQSQLLVSQGSARSGGRGPGEFHEPEGRHHRAFQ